MDRYPITFKVTFNRNGRLNKQGMGNITIQMRQNNEMHYYSWKLKIKPTQWNGYMVTNCLEADVLNQQIEERKVFLLKAQQEYHIKNGKYPTPTELLRIIKENTIPTSFLSDFVQSTMKTSKRKQSTWRNYDTLINDIEKFRKKVRVGDIDYEFIISYDKYLKRCKITNNTIIGRHQILKAIINEAIKRKLITDNPYSQFQIQSMTNKKGFLKKEDVEKLVKNRNRLSRKYQKVLDGFLFCCGTGLRYSDFKKMKNSNIENGWLHITMQKTGFDVDVPTSLLNNLANKVIEWNYNDIEKLARNYPANGTTNKLLKEIFDVVGIEHRQQHLTFHSSRHTMASLLKLEGVAETTIQRLLGHTKLSTTLIYAESSKQTLENDLKNHIGKKR